LVWENGFSQVADSSTQGDALLDVYLVLPESSFAASNILQGISDHYWVILEVEWEENCFVPQVERLVPVYHKTDVLAYRIVNKSLAPTGRKQATATEHFDLMFL